MSEVIVVGLQALKGRDGSRPRQWLSRVIWEAAWVVHLCHLLESQAGGTVRD